MSQPVRHRALRLHGVLQPRWDAPRSRLGFLADVNHSVIGKRFMATAFAFFGLGGVLAMLIRAQLAGPETNFLDAAEYAQVFTMHGTVMMFLFAIPLIEGFALYMLPKMLGSRDLAYPRLSAFGYWCYLFGGSMLVLGLLLGVAPDGGWFMYTPLSSKPFSPGINADLWLIGVTFVEVSAVCAAVEIVVTVLNVRTAGMALSRMPLLCWYLWVTAAMMLIGFPPLILGSILLELERAFGWPFFDPSRGGDPLLWQHLFWLFGHPEVYIIFLPAAGIVSTLIPVFSGRPIVGYGWIVAALIAQAFISFGLWVHHMFATGIPHMSLAFFSAASLLVVVPTAIQIFAWLATLLQGRPRMSVPMLYVFGFLFTFVAGGLTGVMVAVVPFDWQAHDTHFVVAHLHYVLIGGFVFPVMAGLYYWLPHVTGRLADSTLARGAFWVIFTGFHGGFLVMHLTGLLGMPRRIYSYPAGLGWDWPNLVSSIGGFILAIGFAMVLLDLASHWRFSPRTRRNPWNAGTLEWGMALPPPTYNIASQPRVGGRAPLFDQPDLPPALAAGEGFLAGAPRDRRETLCVDAVTGEPSHVLVLPEPSYIPLATAAAAGLFFTGFLLKFWWAAGVGAVLVLIAAGMWMWRSGTRRDPDLVDAGCETSLPEHSAVRQPPGWWGLVFTLTADGALFAALVFGYFFLWVIAPNWPPPQWISPAPLTAMATVASLVLSWGCVKMAMQANEKGAQPALRTWLAASATAGLVGAVALFAVPLWLAPSPREHAYGAATAVLAGYAGFHVLLGIYGSVYAILRSRAGYISRLRIQDLLNVELFWRSVAVGGVLVVLLIHGLPAWMAS
jgi:cytochrome c oxidase subunit I+III